MRTQIRFAALAAGIATSLFVAMMPSANADSFDPQADPPTQEVLAFPKALQPAYPNSTSIYTVTVAVGSQGGVDLLDHIEMCWFKDTNANGSSTGLNVDNCGSPDSNGWKDPRTQFSMRWTNWHALEGAPVDTADQWFSVDESYDPSGFLGAGYWTNYYEHDGSTSGFGDGTGYTMDIAFRFRISVGMLQGNDWNIVVRAVDRNDQMTPQLGSNISVAYFGSVQSQRPSEFYGDFSAGDSNYIQSLSEGSLLANAASYITYEATPFTYQPLGGNLEQVPLATGTPNTAPGAGQAAFDCTAADGGWNPDMATRLSTVPQQVRANVLVDGTGEWDGNHGLYHACRIWYGGSAPVANQYYTNTFIAGIGQYLD